MNARKKRKLLILFALLCLNLLALTFYTFRAISSSNLSLQKSYPFLRHFTKVSQSLSNTIYSAEGLIYNVRISEDTITFDMNIFKDNSYIEDISLPLDQALLDSSTIYNKGISTVSILLKFSKTSIFKNFSITEFSLQGKQFSKDKISEILKEMYPTVSGENVNLEEHQYIKIPLLSATIGEGIYDLRMVGYNIAPLYRVYLDSKLMKSSLKNQYSSNIYEYLRRVEQYKENKLLPRNGLQLPIQKVYPFSCMLVNTILNEKVLKKEEEKILVDNYCNKEQFIEKFKQATSIKTNPEYTFKDLLSSINHNRINYAIDKTKDDKNNYWQISLIGDIRAAESVHKGSLDIDANNEQLKKMLSTDIIWSKKMSLKSVCEAFIVLEAEPDLHSKIKHLLTQEPKTTLQLMDTQTFDSLICLTNLTNIPDFDNLINAFLHKTYSSKYAKKDSFVGIWENNHYELYGNVLFFNMLLESHEEL